VSSPGSNQVLKYNAQTGAFVGVGAGGANVSAPKDVKFGSDGLVYVLSANNNRIFRYTAGGTYVDDFVPAGSGGMISPHRMAFGPDGDLYVAALQTGSILRFGTESEVLFTVTNSTPSTLPLTVNYATANGSALAGSDYTSTSDTLTLAPGVTSGMIRIPILDDSAVEPSETFSVILSNAVAATITDDTGVATTLDNDSTKFYVVDDASPDRTFRYGTPGNSLGNSTLASGDTAPRGAAAKADGSTVWVVDANKTVYVYSASGGLLGSWTAGGMQGNPQVEGIATNGTDIWLLDNAKDKVYRYTSAASRTSGSHNAASSFSLTASNSNAKGIVTDGTALWVVDDGTTDKVFKHNLSGTLLGSWTIDAANSSPTGLTINPNNVSDIWVVDSVTKKVYQYTAAVGNTSGSQNAAASFALAANNTNPQDIADPPPGTRLVPAPVPEHAAADGRMAESRPFATRPVPDGGATPAGARPLLPSWLAGALAQATPIVPLASNTAGQPGIHAPVAPSAAEALSAKRSAANTTGPSLFTIETPTPRHRAVDQVFADPALELLDGDLLQGPVASV
jgi:hypothetical protein